MARNRQVVDKEEVEGLEIRRVSGPSTGTIDQLCETLVAVVNSGAAVGFLPPLSQTAAREYWNDVLQSGALLWTAEEEGVVQGTVQLHIARKPNAPHRAEVAKLLVHPRAQRRGIGARLMAALEAEARNRGITLLVLDTREGDPSNRLYLGLGFQEAGRVPQYAKSADGELHTTVIYYKLLDR